MGDVAIMALIVIVAGGAGIALGMLLRRGSAGSWSAATMRRPGRVPTTVSAEPRPEPGPDPSTLSFDEALAELQQTVAALEAGGAPLEASLALYERGVALHERCAALLADAELRVSRLVERAGGAIEALELKTTDES